MQAMRPKAQIDFYKRLDEIGASEVDRARAKDAFARSEAWADWLVRAFRFVFHARLPASNRALGPLAP